MTAIVESVEIARTPAEVYAYVTDPTHLPEWQESVVSAERVGGEPRGAGSTVKVVRRIGRVERTMTAELAAINPRPAGRYAESMGRFAGW